MSTRYMPFSFRLNISPSVPMEENMKATMVYSQRNSDVIDTKYLIKLREERSKKTSQIKKRAIYARVSTREQAITGYGVDAQLTNIMNKLKADGIDLNDVEVYIDDGYSAKSLNRPEMQRLLKDILDDKINEVIIYKLDRLARNVIDTYELLQFFIDQQCELKAVVDNLDIHSANGRLLVGVLAIIAQWEREVIKERASDANEEMLNQGKYPFGQVPFGYDRDTDGYLHINLQQAEYIRYCFELAISGNTMKEIEYTAPLKFLTIQKKAEVIRNMLLRTINYGVYVFEDKEYELPGLVSKKTYDKAKRMIYKRYKETNPSKYYFGNKITDTCGDICERKSTSKKLKAGVRKYYYYVCPKCQKRISQERIVEATLSRIALFAAEHEDMKNQKHFYRRLRTLDKKTKEAFQNYTSAKIDAKVYGVLISELDKERDKIIDELSVETKSRDMNTDKWNDMSDKDRKHYIEYYVKEIIVDLSLKTIISIEFNKEDSKK